MLKCCCKFCENLSEKLYALNPSGGNQGAHPVGGTVGGAAEAGAARGGAAGGSGGFSGLRRRGPVKHGKFRKFAESLLNSLNFDENV